MSKVSLPLILFVVVVGAWSTTFAQLDSTRYLDGLANRYKVDYYASSEVAKSMTIQNIANTLKKPNRNPDEISLSGLDLKTFYSELTTAIQNLFSASKWDTGNLPEGYKIGIELGVLKTGKIAELLSLIVPRSLRFSGTDIEQLEAVIKRGRITVTDSSRYSQINFMPIFFAVRPVK